MKPTVYWVHESALTGGIKKFGASTDTECPTQHTTGHFGHKSFQVTDCTGSNNQTNKHRRFIPPVCQEF